MAKTAFLVPFLTVMLVRCSTEYNMSSFLDFEGDNTPIYHNMQPAEPILFTDPSFLDSIDLYDKALDDFQFNPGDMSQYSSGLNNSYWNPFISELDFSLVSSSTPANDMVSSEFSAVGIDELGDRSENKMTNTQMQLDSTVQSGEIENSYVMPHNDQTIFTTFDPSSLDATISNQKECIEPEKCSSRRRKRKNCEESLHRVRKTSPKKKLNSLTVPNMRATGSQFKRIRTPTVNGRPLLKYRPYSGIDLITPSDDGQTKITSTPFGKQIVTFLKAFASQHTRIFNILLDYEKMIERHYSHSNIPIAHNFNLDNYIKLKLQNAPKALFRSIKPLSCVLDNFMLNFSDDCMQRMIQLDEQIKHYTWKMSVLDAPPRDKLTRGLTIDEQIAETRTSLQNLVRKFAKEKHELLYSCNMLNYFGKIYYNTTLFFTLDIFIYAGMLSKVFDAEYSTRFVEYLPTPPIDDRIFLYTSNYSIIPKNPLFYWLFDFLLWLSRSYGINRVSVKVVPLIYLTDRDTMYLSEVMGILYVMLHHKEDSDLYLKNPAFMSFFKKALYKSFISEHDGINLMFAMQAFIISPVGERREYYTCLRRLKRHINIKNNDVPHFNNLDDVLTAFVVDIDARVGAVFKASKTVFNLN